MSSAAAIAATSRLVNHIFLQLPSSVERKAVPAREARPHHLTVHNTCIMNLREYERIP
jgi:hypothetical protein